MRLIFLILMLCSCSVRAAFTDFYVNNAGGATNSGHTPDAAPTFSFLNGAWDQTTGVYVAAGASLTGVTNGAWASVYVDGATVAVFVGRVLAVDDGLDTITVSVLSEFGAPPTTSATARSIVVGGAFLFPNGTTTDVPFTLVDFNATNAAGNPPCLNIKSNLYVTTGQIGSISTAYRIEGYGTVPHDLAGRPLVIPGAGASFIMFQFTGNEEMVNMEFNGSNFTSGSSVVINAGNGGFQTFTRCVVKNSRGAGFSSVTTPSAFRECEAANNAGTGFDATGGGQWYNCISHDNTNAAAAGGISVTGSGTLVNTIAYNNNANGFFFRNGNSIITGVNCDSWHNSTNGFALANAQAYLINCNALRNGSFGYDATSAVVGSLTRCGRGSGTQTNAFGNFSPTALIRISDDDPLTYASGVTPWRDPTNGNFSINLSAAIASGRGFFLQSTVFAPTNTVGYPDIGAAQSDHTNRIFGASMTFAQ